MTDPKGMSVEEILAACRRIDGGQSDDAPAETPAPAAEAPAAAAPAAEKPAAAPSGKKASEMSVAEMLAAARGEKAAGEKPAEEAEAAPAEAAPAAPAKKAGEMSVAEMLAAARGETAKPAAAKPAAAKPAADKASPKPAAKAAPKSTAPVATGPKDTQSILAAARKQHQPGPMSKAEAAAKTSPAAPAKPKPVAPPMPEKPAYAKAQPAKAKAKEDKSDRRGFILTSLGSFLALGFTSLTLTNLFWVLGLARYMFPNILTEPPSKFKVGFPADFAPGQVATKFKAKFGVWVVNYEYNGQPELFALKSVCTHLGCTPNWLEAEQKFKCPCHGSGFYKDGVNFEGPAPRPLERYAIRVADDGQIEIDKSKTFQEELGQWADPGSFVQV